MMDFTGYDFKRPLTAPVEQFNNAEMVQFAAKRSKVQLEDGRIVTLIRWRTPRRTSQVRVQFLNGNLVTLKLRQVKAVLIDPLPTGETP